jgi:hypothetical protein
MASTYSTLKIELIGTGEQAGLWGTTTNTNLGTAIEEAIVGSADVSFSSADVTLTLTNTNAAQTARNLRLNLTGTSGGARNLILGSGCQIEKPYLINNGLADTVTVKNTTGTGIAVPAGKSMWVYNNGTNVVDAVTHLTSLTLGSALPVASGGTGQTSYTDGQLLIGNTTGNTLAKATLTAGTGIAVTNGAGTISIAATNNGTVTSVGGTGTVNGITLTGTVTSTGNLTLGGTLSNVSLSTQVTGTLPIANGGSGQTTAQTAMNAFAGAVTSGSYLRGNGSNVVMSTIQAGDVPTLNQNTTGTAANVTGTVAIANGGTGATTNTTARTNLGATTVGSNFFTLTNPSAIRFVRINADNTVSSLTDTEFRTAIGAGSGGGSVTSVATGTGLTGGPITTTGTISVATNGVTDALFRQSAGLSVVGRSANTTGNVADVIAATDHQVLRRSGTAIGFGAINLASTDAVTNTLPIGNGGTGQTSYTNGQLLIGNTTGNTLAKATLTAGSGISITNGAGSITIASTGGAGTVTSVGGTGTVNGITLTGTVTSSGNLTLGGTLSNVSLSTQVTGTLPIANGGTGQTTQQAALNALAGATTSAQFLRGNGTNVLMSAIQAADVPTLNQNTTGSAATLTTARTFQTNLASTSAVSFNGSANVTPGVTGTLPVANGGTGVTSSTGSGSNVLSTSPSLTTPVLGTPTSGNLSNCTVDGTDAVGFRNTPINSQSAAYTMVLADSGKTILHPIADNNARTFTIPANSSVAYPLGTVITFVNLINTVTIAITSDTMYLAGPGTTGSRTLAAYGVATAVKLTSTSWLISGNGLT